MSTKLSRQFLLDVWKNGAVTIRRQGQAFEGGLPVWSTDTYEEASAIRVRCCVATRDLTSDHTYYLPAFSGNVEDLDYASALFAHASFECAAQVKGKSQ